MCWTTVLRQYLSFKLLTNLIANYFIVDKRFRINLTRGRPHSRTDTVRCHSMGNGSIWVIKAAATYSSPRRLMDAGLSACIFLHPPTCITTFFLFCMLIGNYNCNYRRRRRLLRKRRDWARRFGSGAVKNEDWVMRSFFSVGRVLNKILPAFFFQDEPKKDSVIRILQRYQLA